ncbi:MAG TPA: hypothetical protein VFY13_09215, partial [Luteolibacter sp.]|nr:hypothetical protein [Luteolibacter sp.]
SDVATRENQINAVVTHLQTSSNALREEIARLKRKPQRKSGANDPQAANAPKQPTPVHRIVAFLCQLALHSEPAQSYLGEQFETLHEAAPWLEGIPLLERILSAAPDPNSNAAVNAFMGSLEEADRLALLRESNLDGAPSDGLQAAEHALGLLSATVLQKRDAAVKAALKEPNLAPARMVELLEQAKEISALMRGIGQRSEFDDELPKSTFKAKEPEWKRKKRE